MYIQWSFKLKIYLFLRPKSTDPLRFDVKDFISVKEASNPELVYYDQHNILPIKRKAGYYKQIYLLRNHISR